jgi:hypothetical protein
MLFFYGINPKTNLHRGANNGILPKRIMSLHVDNLTYNPFIKYTGGAP